MTASPIATQETVNPAASKLVVAWLSDPETPAAVKAAMFTDDAARLVLRIDEALSSAERRNEELVRAHDARLLEIGNERQADGDKYLAALKAYRAERERATKAESALASLTGTVGELREKAFAYLRREGGRFDMQEDDIEALVSDMQAKAILEPSPPGISTTGGDGWMPIETAPKNETPVLVFCPSYYQGTGGISWAVFVQGRWLDSRAFPTEPTHWRPLPRPPGEPEA